MHPSMFSALQESSEGAWLRGGGSLQGPRWSASSLSRGIWMWSHPFLLGKEGRKVRGGRAGKVKSGSGRKGRESRDGQKGGGWQ